MAPTPQSNATLPEIARLLGSGDNIVICGHAGPDGDCLGSQLALRAALAVLGKRVACVLAKDDPIDPNLMFLPGVEGLVPADAYDGPCDVFVAVDAPSLARMSDAAAALLASAGLSITIDHHASDARMTDFAYIDPQAASASMLVWDMAGHLGVSRAGAVATCAYTGLMTDTGRFQFQNADARCFAAAAEMVAAGARPDAIAQEVFQNRSLASLLLEQRMVERMRLSKAGDIALSWLTRADFEHCGATKVDADPLVNTLRSIRGVRVSCILREQDGVVRGSLRAKDDTDVSAIARAYGGGGHKAAAGFTMEGFSSAEEASKVMFSLIEQSLAPDSPGGHACGQACRQEAEGVPSPQAVCAEEAGAAEGRER